jgi:hypothetical protein
MKASKPSDAVLADHNWTLFPPDAIVSHLPYLHDAVVERALFEDRRLLRLDLRVPHIDLRLRLYARGVLAALADFYVEVGVHDDLARRESSSFAETLLSFGRERTSLYATRVIRSPALQEELLDIILVQKVAPRLRIICKEVQLVDEAGNPCLEELNRRGSEYWDELSRRAVVLREERAQAKAAAASVSAPDAPSNGDGAVKPDDTKRR